MTTTITSKILQELLETEYPLLDTSLLAALISDYPSIIDLGDDSIQTLRHMLSQLSLEADTQQLLVDSDAHASHSRPESSIVTSVSSSRLDGDLPINENSRSSPNVLLCSGSGTPTSISSGDTHSFSSPLNFLRLLFPQLPIQLVEQTLSECGIHDNGSSDFIVPEGTDMSAVVEHLLTLEYIQDFTDRDLGADSDVNNDNGVWRTASTSGKHILDRPKSKRTHTHTMPLVDIRQRQHILPESANKTMAVRPQSLSADPWTRLTSLATRLSDLLQPIPSGFFMSYFHAPTLNTPTAKNGWKAEGDALRSALSDLVTRSSTMLDDAKVDGCIDAIRDVVLSPDQFVKLDERQKSRFESDLYLCVVSAEGESSTALDLVWLLRDLDEAFDQGHGIAHYQSTWVNSQALSPEKTTKSVSSVETPASADVLATRPPPIPPPPLSSKHPPSKSSSDGDGEWTRVEHRRRRSTFRGQAFPHAEFIPTYSDRSPRIRRPVKGTGNQFGKGDVGERTQSVEWYKDRACEMQSQRNEALREAMRHWQRGNARSRGGEVAFYYAEKARELQGRQKEWALNAAQMMVEEKRLMCGKDDTLDLHGLTVAEACVIVKQALDVSPPSSSQPLKIITGRGRHSIGQVGVLGPALMDMLRTERFNVSKWDGGLIVRGKR